MAERFYKELWYDNNWKTFQCYALGLVARCITLHIGSNGYYCEEKHRASFLFRGKKLPGQCTEIFCDFLSGGRKIYDGGRYNIKTKLADMVNIIQI